MLSKLTILGLHQYTDGAIWDYLTLPEGMDKEVVIAEIIRQCKDFSTIYTDAELIKEAIGAWSKKWLHNFERWYTAYNFQYNALYNLDVEATYIDDGSDNRITYDHNTGYQQTYTKKAAYDTDAYKNAESDELLPNLTHDGTDNNYHKNTRTEVRKGNQGVTMSQEMLLAEYDAWKANIYSMIAECFAAEFCICIYS